MPRCKYHKTKFEAKYFNQKYCLSDDACIKAFSEFVQSEKEKKEKKAWSKKKKEGYVKLLSADGYREKYVQPVINEIARLIDYGQPCIVTELYEGKMNGGHYIAVGANRTTALNLHNIHMQSFHSNHWKSGDNLKYRAGLAKTYGKDYMESVEALHKTKPIKLTKEDLKEVKKTASEIRLELKEGLQVFSPEERIALRDDLNLRIGIYESLFTN